MKVSRKSKRNAKRLFRMCMTNGKLDADRVRSALTRMVTERRRDTTAILAHFGRMAKQYAARHTATVESAEPLTDELRKAVEEDLKRMHGDELAIEFRQSPALIGGMRVKVGSDVYDGTVRAGLTALERSF